MGYMSVHTRLFSFHRLELNAFGNESHIFICEVQNRRHQLDVFNSLLKLYILEAGDKIQLI